MTEPARTPASIGAFARLGLSEPWQAALLMPASYDDLREPYPSAATLEGNGRGLLHLTPDGPWRSSCSRGVPRVRLAMRDASGASHPATAFGDTAIWQERFEAGAAWYVCETNRYRDELQLRLVELVPDEWVGRIRPRYPAIPNGPSADQVRGAVMRELDRAVPTAAAWLGDRLHGVLAEPGRAIAAAGLPGWTLDDILAEAHLPATPDMHERARTALRRLAALMSLAKSHAHVMERGPATPWALPTWRARAAALPVPLTEEQLQAIEGLVTEIGKAQASRSLLTGDVGSGKTYTYGTVVAALTGDAGGRAAVLLPTQPLAEQVAREIEQAWPDLKPRLVLGATADEDLATCPLLVGTTALLHREVGMLDLVVVDEEQKFSVEQREQLASTRCHLLTATATCIPRSLALAKYGALAVFELRGGHVEKNVHSRLWQASERVDLFAELRTFLARGEQLLVVYPLREAGADAPDDRQSVEQAARSWEALRPGKVRRITGPDDDTEKSAVLADMREGRAQVLVATTAVEVGINLPNLRRILIVSPERHGLTTLHQLRGRVARRGGEGWCDLFAADPLSDKASERLTAFLKCTSGFEVAELDLRLRGFGDLAPRAKRQSGADSDLLFGDAPGAEDVDAMAALWQEAAARKRPAS